ncbi:uncharacterized protein LOC111078241 [Drosophila obscura]|uniref:uncharacterized protein LOC111078241 n=1 Tax=Drosophila obscura TaxID=7282 RepID=UPI001BB14341|nr:uncharacterized protein LOC111078241 [Drosophila obscura]
MAEQRDCIWALMKRCCRFTKKGEEKKSFEKLCQLFCHSTKKTYPLLAYHSYMIPNSYPGPLVTYDRMARCEMRLMTFSDLTDSYLTLVFDKLAEQEKKRIGLQRKKGKSCAVKKESKCRKKRYHKCTQKPKKRESCPTKKKSSAEKKANLRAMIRSEIRAERLYEMELGRCPKDGKLWLSLMPRQKLPHHCRGHTGERLRATAYSNFQQSFGSRFRQMHPRACRKRVRAETRTRWDALKCDQRVRFVMMALFYHVSTGALDPLDKFAVGAMYRKLKGTD